MKKPLIRLVVVTLTTALFSSCATTYDAHGNRRDVVTPEGAIAGAVVAGLIGYSISKNRHKDNDRRYHRRGRGHYDHGYGYNGHNRCGY